MYKERQYKAPVSHTLSPSSQKGLLMFMTNRNATIQPLKDIGEYIKAYEPKDTSKNITVPYLFGHINCVKYNKNVKTITSSNFSGCIMAMFRCKKNIGEIKQYNKYAAHVANDNVINYKINNNGSEGVRLGQKGKNMLVDLVDNDFIDELKYFRPYTKGANSKTYNRNILHKIEMAKKDKYQYTDLETGIIKIDSSGKVSAYHKFDYSEKLNNPELKIELNVYDKGSNTDNLLLGYNNFYDKDLDDLFNFLLMKKAPISVVTNIGNRIRKDEMLTNETLYYVAENNVDIGEGEYDKLPLNSRSYYENLLVQKKKYKIPSWLKKRYWLKYIFRDAIKPD